MVFLQRVFIFIYSRRLGSLEVLDYINSNSRIEMI